MSEVTISMLVPTAKRIECWLRTCDGPDSRFFAIELRQINDRRTHEHD